MCVLDLPRDLAQRIRLEFKIVGLPGRDMQYGIAQFRQSRRDIGPVFRDSAPRRRVVLAAELKVSWEIGGHVDHSQAIAGAAGEDHRADLFRSVYGNSRR